MSSWWFGQANTKIRDKEPFTSSGKASGKAFYALTAFVSELVHMNNDQSLFNVPCSLFNAVATRKSVAPHYFLDIPYYFVKYSITVG